MKYLVTFVGGSTELFSDEDIPSLWADMEILSIVREDQKLYPWSPREFYERVLDIWEERTGVNGKPRVVTPADWKWSLEQALAELEGEGLKA